MRKPKKFRFGSIKKAMARYLFAQILWEQRRTGMIYVTIDSTAVSQQLCHSVFNIHYLPWFDSVTGRPRFHVFGSLWPHMEGCNKELSKKSFHFSEMFLEEYWHKIDQKQFETIMKELLVGVTPEVRRVFSVVKDFPY